MDREKESGRNKGNDRFKRRSSAPAHWVSTRRTYFVWHAGFDPTTCIHGAHPEPRAQYGQRRPAISFRARVQNAARVRFRFALGHGARSGGNFVSRWRAERRPRLISFRGAVRNAAGASFRLAVACKRARQGDSVSRQDAPVRPMSPHGPTVSADRHGSLSPSGAARLES